MKVCNVLIGVTVVIALVPHTCSLALYRIVMYTFVASIYLFQRPVLNVICLHHFHLLGTQLRMKERFLLRRALRIMRVFHWKE